MRALHLEEGSALVEFSLLAGLVIFMFFGIVDFGIAIQRAMVVTDAARVVAEYGTIFPSTEPGPNAINNSYMSAAADNAAQALSGMTVTPTYFYVCTPGGPQVSSASSCATNPTPLLYVQVNTSASIQALVGYPGLPGSFALQGVSVLRVP